MPPTKRLPINHHQLSGKSLSVGVSLGPGPKLQFPSLPQEWRDRYVPGQMYRYQDSLPKLPVPSLQQTLEKYVASVEVRNYSERNCLAIDRLKIFSVAITLRERAGTD